MPVVVLVVLAVYAAALAVTATYWAATFVLLASFIAVGTIGFWSLLALDAVFVLYCLDNDHDDRLWAGWSTLSVGLTLCILQFGTELKPVTFIIQNPMSIAVYFLLYVMVGLVWSVGKWYFVGNSRRRKKEMVRRDYLRACKIQGNEIPADKLLEWDSYFREVVRNDYRGKKYKLSGVSSLNDLEPSLSKYRERIIGWTAFWPLSFAWTMVNDPLVRFFNNLYDYMQNVYQKVSDHIFAGHRQELEAISRAKESSRQDGDDSRRRRA